MTQSNRSARASAERPRQRERQPAEQPPGRAPRSTRAGSRARRELPAAALDRLEVAAPPVQPARQHVARADQPLGAGHRAAPGRQRREHRHAVPAALRGTSPAPPGGARPTSGLGGVSCATSRIERPRHPCQYRAAWTAAPELSVVLVNHNGAGCLPAALEALAARHDASRASSASSSTRARPTAAGRTSSALGGARALRFEDNIGFCAGCNRGAEAARGRLLAFVNFDGARRAGLGRAAARAARRDPGRRRSPPACCVARRRRDDRGGRAGDRAEHGDVRAARGRAARAGARRSRST